MKTKIIESNNTIIIECKGDIIGGPDAEEFNLLLRKYIDEGKKNIILDLSGVKYMNSTGIGILIRGYTTMKNAGGELKLANLTEKIQGLLVITQLTKVFDVYKSTEEAVNSFAVKV